jgi:hypothetical protein
VQSFGNALQAALEHEDAAQLSALFVRHQALLALTTDLRRWQYDSAACTVETLKKRQKAVKHRRTYYQRFVDIALKRGGKAQGFSRDIAIRQRATEATLELLSGALALIPELRSAFSAEKVGAETDESAESPAMCLPSLFDLANVVCALPSVEAGSTPREQWSQQVQGAQEALEELDTQIRAAEVRQDTAQQLLTLHEKTLEQTSAMYLRYRERLTDPRLYRWLSTETQRIYGQASRATYGIAQLAEHAFRFETGEETTVSLSRRYWKAGAAPGVGDRLLGELRSLERQFIEANHASLMVDQSFSLRELDPVALVQLRRTGRCQFAIPALALDVVHPGQYQRRVRSVRLAIPCLTAPYATVNVTLRMLGSHMRCLPEVDNDHLVGVPLEHAAAIAMSTGKSERGVSRRNVWGRAPHRL